MSAGAVDVLAVLDDLFEDLTIAGNYSGEGCWFNDGEEDRAKVRYAESRAAVAEAFETITEGKRQWDQVAASLGVDGDDADAVIARAAAVAELVEAATRANGGHTAPHDCYATGPLTGNPVRDLVECPGCVLAQVLARFGSAP